MNKFNWNQFLGDAVGTAGGIFSKPKPAAAAPAPAPAPAASGGFADLKKYMLPLTIGLSLVAVLVFALGKTRKA
jgi:hypothetical protein